MSDLISRKKVIDILEKEKSLRCSYDADITIFSIEKGIRELPTSYSVENVVEELEENASRYTKKYVTPYGNNGYRDTKAISIRKATEIVKQGCVSDDVCEWKVFDNSLTDEPQWVYETTCGKYAGEEHTSKAFAYCPCCGKKIKIVGD